jgi:ABC-type dipeptide/oligopeptide/nickel transport system permease subunit
MTSADFHIQAIAEPSGSTSGHKGRLAALRLLSRPSAVVGLSLLTFLVLCAIFADQISSAEPNKVLIGLEPGAVPQLPPCIHLLGCAATQPQHLLGLDSNVRDEWSRVVHGTRVSLQIGVLVVALAILIGTPLGAVAGYSGGSLDNAVMRVMDVLLAFPALLLAIAIVTVLGPGLVNAQIAVGIVRIPVYARLIRASVISIKEHDFVLAARALGDSPLNLLFRRIVPNAWAPLLVQGTLDIGKAILDVAGLSFLGLGAEPPQAEWGSMISLEHNSLFSASFLIMAPGIAIVLTVLAFTLLGDSLRNELDPRLRV